MRMITASALALACLLSVDTQAQTLSDRPYIDWPIVRNFITPQKKILPDGFYHFRPVSSAANQQRYSGETMVVCKPWYDDPNNPGAKAITFASRLYDGYSPLRAVDEIKTLHGGHAPCGFYHGSLYSITDVSVRGDEKSRKVFLLKMRETKTGEVLYTGIPYEYLN